MYRVSKQKSVAFSPRRVKRNLNAIEIIWQNDRSSLFLIKSEKESRKRKASRKERKRVTLPTTVSTLLHCLCVGVPCTFIENSQSELYPLCCYVCVILWLLLFIESFVTLAIDVVRCDLFKVSLRQYMF